MAESPVSSKNILQRLYSEYGKWGRKIAAAIADQGVFAGSNFVAGVLLARWMSPEEFGAYAVAYTWFQLILNFYEALITDPMNLYGAGKYSNHFQRYLGYVLYSHVGASLLLSGVLGVAALLLTQFDSLLVASAFAGTALGAPFLLLRASMRQPFYILSTPHRSATSSMLYGVAVVAAPIMLNFTGQLNAFSAMLTMAFATLVGYLYTFWKVRPQFTGTIEGVTPRDMALDHWRFGRWSLSSRALTWVAGNSGYIVVPLVLSLAETGALKAMMNLTMPMVMINQAMLSLLIPTFVRIHEKQGKSALRQRVGKVNRVVFAFACTYGLLIAVFGQPLIHLFYRGVYDEYATLPFIITMAIVPVLAMQSRIYQAGLVAMNKNRYTVQARLVPSFLSIVLDFILISAVGLIGFNLESIITASMVLYMVRFYYLREVQRETPVPEKEPSEITDAVPVV